MKIIFSRHAKGRAKLYNISEDMIKNLLLSEKYDEGKKEIIKEVFGFKYPI